MAGDEGGQEPAGESAARPEAEAAAEPTVPQVIAWAEECFAGRRMTFEEFAKRQGGA